MRDPAGHNALDDFEEASQQDARETSLVGIYL